jgi:hypothetical protein
MTEEQQLSYFAGFFDGEGCVTFNKVLRKSGNVFYTLVVHIKNCNPYPLIELQKVFEGSIYKESERGQNHRTTYRWMVTGLKGVLFLIAIKDLLIIKAEEADLAIKLFGISQRYKQHGVRVNRVPEDVMVQMTDLYDQITALKHKEYIDLPMLNIENSENSVDTLTSDVEGNTEPSLSLVDERKV